MAEAAGYLKITVHTTPKAHAHLYSPSGGPVLNARHLAAAEVEYAVGHQLPRKLNLGETLTARDEQELGLRAGKLTERHVAFLILLALDRHGELRPAAATSRHPPQRVVIADRLGMTVPALRRELGRHLAPMPGHVIRWASMIDYRRTSRTGGPWSLGVKDVLLCPDVRTAEAFVALQQLRTGEPEELLALALAEREADRWIHALAILEAAWDMFWRSGRARDSREWFEIQLALAWTEMQLGVEGGQPEKARNVLRSVNIQRLGGPAADYVRARALYTSGLVINQQKTLTAKRDAIAQFEQARTILSAWRTPDAVREYWRITAEREGSIARIDGTVQPKHSSALLRASKEIEGSREQKRMQYGETLLYANRPKEALDYVSPAIASGRLPQSALVIAERVEAMAYWQTGGKKSAVLEALDRVVRKTTDLGFQDQRRAAQWFRRIVRGGSRRRTLRENRS